MADILTSVRLRQLLPLSLLVASIVAQTEPPQESKQQDPGGFRIGVRVDQVFLSVNARALGGGFIDDMRKEDFHVFEDGVEQVVQTFSRGQAPVHVALLIDSSGSTKFSQKSIQGAAYRFAERLDKDDRVSIVTFSSQVRLILDWTNDLNRVKTKLKSIWAKGRTVLNDAVYVTYDDLFKDLPGKKAIILMTDGVDVGSMVGFEDVLGLAERSEAAVYVVSLLEEYRHTAASARIELRARLQPVPLPLQEDYIRQSSRFLERLTRNTGGRIFNAASATELSDIYEEVAQEIKNQYYLSYIPTNGTRDGRWRAISIEADRLDAQVSTRPGYYSDSEEDSGSR